MSRADLKEALFEQFALVARSLASAKRMDLLDVLAQGERTVEVLAQATGLKLTTASAHLQTLRHGGLVTSRKDGTRIYYRLAGDDVARLYTGIREVSRRHLAETERAARDFLGEDDLEPVGREELCDRIRSGTVFLVDVRPEEEFAAAHIEGAVSVPLAELAGKVRELPGDIEVVAYCRGEYCVLAYDAVRLLRAKGRPARRMAGGMLEWRIEGRPTTRKSA
ncbi:MAG: metalloregulator ArsR/SmtB family transcription factor [Streptosporangiaceae bacterium]|nr:metalloregulator ArsR/SmtB family transcription factor [Streptosporangiaceae bacterium]